MSQVNLQISVRQREFLNATADEVLFGGAAGGGKSYGQLVDALIFALRYPKSKQAIFRRTFPELEKSIIRTAMEIFPRDQWTYNASSHTGRFNNGSIIDFSYLANDNDVYQYQSAEYDVIRFDELTHFTEFQYTYLFSRVRGANGYPKQLKSSTNPGGVGHQWVKARFIDPMPPNEVYRDKDGRTRVFIPSKVDDNIFLMATDADYKKRLEHLGEAQKKALLYGEWDIYEGQYFPEFNREVHVCEPFDIPSDWRRYRAFDYGLDCFACLWVAVSPSREIFVYKEISKPNMRISEAAAAALNFTEDSENIHCTLAPPDMWSRSQESGKSKADLFYESGLTLTKSSNNREAGWLAIKEMLAVKADQPRLKIFRNCTELIKCIPALLIDEKKPTDCSTEPHEYTHACLSCETLVETVEGPMPIKDLVGKEGYVYSYNEQTGEKEVNRFFDVMKTKENAETIKIEMDDGRCIVCTKDHPILTDRGWVKAENLQIGDDIKEIK